MFRPRRFAHAWAVAALIVLLILPAVALSASTGEPRIGRALPATEAVAATTGPPAGAPGPLATASATEPPSATIGRAPAPMTATTTTTGIVPGSVNRTSLDLISTYGVGLRLNFATRRFIADTTITVVNTSGGPIDRLELNTIAARLGGMRLTMVTVGGTPMRATIDDQTIIVPLGGILEVGASTKVRVVYSATLRSTLTGSNWLFTRTNGILEAHRWIPWVSRRTPFNRPNHGDPFVTPVSPFVHVSITSDRVLTYATPGSRIAETGVGQTFEKTNVGDFAFPAAPD
jgi:hypothetical protein